MAQLVHMIGGEGINPDYSFNTGISATATPGVLSGLEVSANNVSAGKALVEVTRTTSTPNETFLVTFQLTSDLTIDTSGDKKVFIKIDDNRVNDTSLNTLPDASDIGSIQTDTVYPTTNYIPLASITGGVITDERDFQKLRLYDGTTEYTASVEGGYFEINSI